jgi:hypothetical protein
MESPFRFGVHWDHDPELDKPKNDLNPNDE